MRKADAVAANLLMFRKMQLEKLNHFQKFNLETTFQIDSSELETKYLKLQQQFHPDTAQDKTEAEINSILINQAYQILKNPIKRAIYLLQLQGINIDAEDCIIKPSQENLILVMELREEILDNQNNPAAIASIKQKIKKIIADEMAQVLELLVKMQYQIAAQKLIKVKYLDKIVSDLKNLTQK
ncbi:MAG: Fe-S protein assembly co-chaperone HscB [Pseudomonadota bacterium]